MVVVGRCVGRLDSLVVIHLDCDRLVYLVGLLGADLGGCYVGLVVQVDADLVVCLAYLDVVAYLAIDINRDKRIYYIVKNWT